jgi:hypothetical protein
VGNDLSAVSRVRGRLLCSGTTAEPTISILDPVSGVSRVDVEATGIGIGKAIAAGEQDRDLCAGPDRCYEQQ